VQTRKLPHAQKACSRPRVRTPAGHPLFRENYNTTSSEGLVILLAGDAVCEELPTYLRVAYDSIFEGPLLTWTRRKKMQWFLAF
jgi:hypothetical protein